MDNKTAKFKIYCENGNIFLLSKLNEKVKNNAILKNCKTKIIKNIQNMSMLEISCKKSLQSTIKTNLKATIAQFFAVDYKNDFLKQKINSKFLLPEETEMLTCALTFYDSSIDEQIVYDALKGFDCELFLESFFKFNLSPLEKRWCELSSFANENNIYFTNKNAFLELMKFLISNLESKTEFVELCYENGIVLTCENQQKKFDKSFDDFCFISTLISFLPKKIKIKKLSSFPNQTLNLICTLFEPNLVF